MFASRFALAAVVLAGLAPHAFAQSSPIGTARAQADGATVTVTGTVSRTMGAFAYFQDATGGLTVRQTSGAFFDAVAAGTIKPGCAITVTGKLSSFRGLKQINAADLTTYTLGACGQPPAPQTVTASEIATNGEAYEAELVRVTGLDFVTAPAGALAPGTTYPVRDGSGTADLRIPNATDSAVDGQAAPAPPFAFEGVVGQFTATGATTGGYQLLAIGAGDLISNPTATSSLRFSSASASVSEAAGVFVLAVSLDRAASADVVATVSVMGGSATEGADYTFPTPLSITIPTGQTTASLNVTIANDNVAEGPETVTFGLALQSGPASLGSPATFTLTLNDPSTAPGAGSVCPGLTGQSLITCIRQNYARTNPRSYSSRTSFYTSYYGAGPYRGVYTGRYAPLGSSGDNEINTEHTWPQSKMPNEGTQDGDMHNLYLTIASVNSDRGSLAFGEVADASAQWYGPTGPLRSTTMPTANVEQYSERGGGVFEPREDHKGNAIRAIAYFYALYGTNDQSFWTAHLPILRSWNTLDPADDEERARSVAIKSYQGNENPFILDPTLIDRAFFSTVANEETDRANGASATVRPNPARGRATIAYRVPASGQVTVEVYDVTGRRVLALAPAYALAGAETLAPLDLSGQATGLYTYRVVSGAWSARGTLVVAQ